MHKWSWIFRSQQGVTLLKCTSKLVLISKFFLNGIRKHENISTHFKASFEIRASALYFLYQVSKMLILELWLTQGSLDNMCDIAWIYVKLSLETKMEEKNQIFNNLIYSLFYCHIKVYGSL